MASRGFMLLFYGTGSNIHKMKRWVTVSTVGTPGTSHDLIDNDNSPVTFEAAIIRLMTPLKPLFSTTTDFISAELWSQPTDGDNPLFLQQYSPGESGTSGSAVVLYSQQVISLNTTTGEKMLFYMMNLPGAINVVINFPVGAGTLKTLVDFLASDQGFFITKTGGKVIGGKRFLTKTNDQLRRRGLNI